MSTALENFTDQVDVLQAIGVNEQGVHVDHGLASMTCTHPSDGGLASKCGVLYIGTSGYVPNDTLGKFIFNVLAVVVESEAHLIIVNTREGKLARSPSSRVGSPGAAQVLEDSG